MLVVDGYFANSYSELSRSFSSDGYSLVLLLKSMDLTLRKITSFKWQWFWLISIFIGSRKTGPGPTTCQYNIWLNRYD